MNKGLDRFVDTKIGRAAVIVAAPNEMHLDDVIEEAWALRSSGKWNNTDQTSRTSALAKGFICAITTDRFLLAERRMRRLELRGFYD